MSLLQQAARWFAERTRAFDLDHPPDVLDLAPGVRYVRERGPRASAKAERFSTPDAEATRREHSLLLHDPETEGYVLMVMRREEGIRKVDFHAQVEPRDWPAFAQTAANVVTGTRS